MFQSTHPRGVRPFRPLSQGRASKFQSTHPRGVRHKISEQAYQDAKFQSTHPRGVRRKGNGVKAQQVAGFNPRTHEGCDKFDAGYFNDTNVSIHAPTRGATAYSAKYRILIYKSSHFANINQTITFKVIKSLEFL